MELFLDIVDATEKNSKFKFSKDLSDHDLNKMQQWCQENNCGRRMAWNMFRFKTEAERTMFLLRWS